MRFHHQPVAEHPGLALLHHPLLLLQQTLLLEVEECSELLQPQLGHLYLEVFREQLPLRVELEHPWSSNRKGARPPNQVHIFTIYTSDSLKQSERTSRNHA